MADQLHSDIEPEGVEVTENMGEWFVRVAIDGKVHVSSFEIEAYARAFADGQSIRVGLSRLAKRS